VGGPIHPDVERLLAALPAWKARLGNWNTYSAIGMEKPSVKIPSSINSRSLYGKRDFRRRVRDSLLKHFPELRDIRDPIFKVGPGASAGILLKDSVLLENWQSSARHLTHVEMEAGGVYHACRHGGRREYPLLCVRGISDIIGFRRSADWTKYACHAAASFVRAMIRSNVLGILGFDNSQRRARKVATLVIHDDARTNKSDEDCLKAVLGRILGGDIDIVSPRCRITPE
jgi:hypothetical protein